MTDIRDLAAEVAGQFLPAETEYDMGWPHRDAGDKLIELIEAVVRRELARPAQPMDCPSCFRLRTVVKDECTGCDYTGPGMQFEDETPGQCDVLSLSGARCSKPIGHSLTGRNRNHLFPR